MTGPASPEQPTSPEPEKPSPDEPLAAATADLGQLQDLLRRAAQGQAGVGELKEAVGSYWADHGDALKRAAAALGETARSQMLAQLYQMRAAVNQQLGVRGAPASQEPTAPPPERDSQG